MPAANAERDFVKWFPIEIIPTVLIENVPDIEHRKQPTRTKVSEDMAVPVTQTNRVLMSGNMGTQIVTPT